MKKIKLNQSITSLPLMRVWSARLDEISAVGCERIISIVHPCYPRPALKLVLKLGQPPFCFTRLSTPSGKATAPEFQPPACCF
jgi:hypothetical protein